VLARQLHDARLMKSDIDITLHLDGRLAAYILSCFFDLYRASSVGSVGEPWMTESSLSRHLHLAALTRI